MKTVKAFIERGNDGTFGVYVDLEDKTLNYGIHGDGRSAQEAVEDFKSSYNEMKTFYKELGKKFVETEFNYYYDLPSFLSYYGNILSLAGLERLTGINQGQLSHYVTGHRKPSKKTVERIEQKLHQFADDIRQVAFI
jgi:hypothetical protein